MEADPAPIDLERLLAQAGWVRALALRLLGDEQAADDVVQETWLRALRHPRRARHRAWLSRVARNLASQHRRGESRLRRREERVAAARPEPSQDDTLERAETHRVLTETVLQLPEPYRDVILKRFFDGWSAGEIAERKGVPLRTVRTQLQRGLVRLRANLEQRLGSDWRGCCLLLVQAPALLPGASATLVGLGMKKAIGWSLAVIGVLAVAALAPWRETAPEAPAPATVRAAAAAEDSPGPRPLEAAAGAEELPGGGRTPLVPPAELGGEPKATVLRFRAVNEQGAALPELPVHVWDSWGGRDDARWRERSDESSAGMPEWLAELRRNPPRTDALGTCELAIPGSNWGLRLDLGGAEWPRVTIAPASLLDGQKPPFDMGDVVVPDGVRFSGRVVDENGTGVPGATLHLQGSALRLRWPRADRMSDSLVAEDLVAVTGEGGHFSCVAPTGEWNLGLAGPAHLERVVDRLSLEPGGDASGRAYVLTEEQVARLSFVDPEGLPVPGVKVELRQKTAGAVRESGGRFLRQSFEADQQGRLAINGLSSSLQASAYVSAVGFERMHFSLTGGGERELVLMRPGSLFVQVLDHEGKPVRGVAVGGVASKSEQRVNPARTDVDGMVRLSIPSGGVDRVLLGDLIDPWVSAAPAAESGDSAEKPVVLRAPLASEIAVRVEGLPGPTAEQIDGVYLSPQDGKAGRSRHLPARIDGGWFVFDAVPPGSWSAHGLATMLGTGPLAPGEVEHRGGRSELTLTKAAERLSGSLQVQVVDPHGDPVPDIFVAWKPLGEEGEELRGGGSERTGRDGILRVPSLTCGSYRLRPWSPLLNRAESSALTPVAVDSLIGGIEDGERTELVLRLEQLATLLIEVQRNGEPVSGAEARVWEGNSISPFFSDDRGRIRITLLPTGPRLVDVSAGPGSPQQSRRLELGPGWNQELFEFGGGEIGGELRLEGVALKEAMVWILPRDPEDDRPRSLRPGESTTLAGTAIPWLPGAPSVRSDEQGRFRFLDVAEGAYDLLVVHPDSAPFLQRCRLGAGVATVDLGSLALSKGGRLVIHFPAGRGLNDEEPKLLLGNEEPLWAVKTTRDDEFRGLAPGTYQVSWKGRTQDVVVLPGETTELRFE